MSTSLSCSCGYDEALRLHALCEVPRSLWTISPEREATGVDMTGAQRRGIRRSRDHDGATSFAPTGGTADDQRYERHVHASPTGKSSVASPPQYLA